MNSFNQAEEIVNTILENDDLIEANELLELCRALTNNLALNSQENINNNVVSQNENQEKSIFCTARCTKGCKKCKCAQAGEICHEDKCKCSNCQNLTNNIDNPLED